MPRLTQKELAAGLGLSYATVSRALNGDERVRVETRQRVQRRARELGFSGSAVARALRLRRSLALGVVWGATEGSYWSRVLGALEERARSLGYSVVVSHRAPGEASAGAVQFLCDRQSDAIILCPAASGEELGEIQRIHREVCPVLQFNGRLPGARIPYLGTASRRGSAELCRHLIDLGHSEIVFAAGPEGEYTAAERLAGYREAMEGAGLGARIRVIPGGFTQEEGAAVVAKLLQDAPLPTAVQAVNDPLAIGIFQELRRRGLRVPQDLSLVGYSDDAACELLPAPLTTVSQPVEQLGARAAELAIEMMADPDRLTFEELPDHLIVRASSGKPRID